jgi:hypothetical protein
MFLLINLWVQNLVINVRSLLGLWFLDDMFIMAGHGVKILGFWYFLMGNSWGIMDESINVGDQNIREYVLGCILFQVNGQASSTLLIASDSIRIKYRNPSHVFGSSHMYLDRATFVQTNSCFCPWLICWIRLCCESLFLWHSNETASGPQPSLPRAMYLSIWRWTLASSWTDLDCIISAYQGFVSWISCAVCALSIDLSWWFHSCLYSIGSGPGISSGRHLLWDSKACVLTRWRTNYCQINPETETVRGDLITDYAWMNLSG